MRRKDVEKRRAYGQVRERVKDWAVMPSKGTVTIRRHSKKAQEIAPLHPTHTMARAHNINAANRVAAARLYDCVALYMSRLKLYQYRYLYWYNFVFLSFFLSFTSLYGRYFHLFHYLILFLE
uniref:Uncharacterized protein n=1 Tax=Trypanosoma congolense (strain IL3000) TaxID=1068625 RepID=G0URW5_TRYCI|nr:hypothetical protein, unlikely [Trypanosoma congolense IL3000]